MIRHFDLAVIGGGPAGTSAAITMRRLGFDVLLLEAGRFPRQKVCGEFISPEASTLLSDLLADPGLFARAPSIREARIFLDVSRATLRLAQSAAGISRYHLDAALWQSAAEAGCVVREQMCVNSVIRCRNGFAIDVESEQITARAVINAAGRWSRLRKRPVSAAEHWIGLKGHFFEEPAGQCCDLYFFRGGYCGVQPLGNGVVNAAAMVKPAVAKTLESVFALNRSLKERTRNWTPASDPISTAPLLFRDPITSEDGVLLVGDAAAFLDPFAGDGISIALHSGRKAAEALDPFLHADCTLEEAKRRYDHDYRRLIQPALRGARRLRTLQSLPPALRATAVAFLNVPMLARAAVNATRLKAANL